jgi:secreted Zn-dependent insulinase-like peptidase
MNINHQSNVEKLQAIWQISVEEMRRYEEFYCGREAALESNVYYRNSKARATACSNRLSELIPQDTEEIAYSGTY